MALFETKNLTFSYPDSTNPALRNVSFSVQEGDFIVLCGPSGSGKSTLLRLMKQEISPHGALKGELLYDRVPLDELATGVSAREIGMVFQDPENQMVMDHVMEELIFGLENIGLNSAQMRNKVAEMVHFFGLESLLELPTHELSGGQKQIVNLASVLLMEPRILLLDEPTSQLDPIAAKDFLNMLRRMNEELGIAVVIAEHRLDDVWAIADRVIVLENGNIVHDGHARDVAHRLSLSEKNEFFYYLPQVSQLYLQFSSPNEEVLPISVKEGKHWVKSLSVGVREEHEKKDEGHQSQVILEAKDIDFQYNRLKPRILDRLSLELRFREKLAIVGGNGTGKSTLLKVLAGLIKPQRGRVYFEKEKITGRHNGHIAYLPQNPKLYFSEESVELEIAKVAHSTVVTEEEKAEILDWLNYKTLKNRHPYDLSGGEMQKVAMACLLLRNPKILLVDEPTKGLDPVSKRRFGEWLNHFNKKGISIVFVTHDIDFAATYADRVAMMFRGEITSTASTHHFFNGNAFYTTAVNRMTRGASVPEVLTVEEAYRTWAVRES